jgi:HD-like signal output (HDOD) protein
MLPTSCVRVLNLVARPNLELGELTTVASQDPSIAAAVLRVANSAAMGASGREVRTVREAIARLGVSEVGHVAAAVSARVLFSARAKREQAMFAARRTDLHWGAVTAAAGAAHLAMQRGKGRSDTAYLGGMLHDVGKAVALGSLSALVVAGRASRDIGPAVVSSVLEQVHTELGTDALRHWSMPGYLVTLCATHHDHELGDGVEFTEVHLLRVVDGLLCLRADPSDHSALALLMQSVRVLQIGPLELRAFDSDLRRLAGQMGRVLGLRESSHQARRASKPSA